MSRALLCLVTNRIATVRPLLDVIGEAARAGVDLIQIREGDLGARELTLLTRAAVAAAAGTAARVVVNDRLDVALVAGAAGVHLRGDSFPAAAVRRLSTSAFIVGRSVHDEEEACAVEAAGGCDYLAFGTVFPSASKGPGHKAAGIGALRQVCARVRLPVLAIGGVSVERAADIAEAGAAGLAAIGVFAESPDLARTVFRLRQGFDSGSAAI